MSDTVVLKNKKTGQEIVLKRKRRPFTQMIGENLKEAAQTTYSEGVAPMLHGLSTAAFGIPKGALNKYSPELSKKIFAEQETLGGKALRAGSETLGFLRGGAVKVGGALTRKILGRARPFIQEMAKYGTAGVLQSPEDIADWKGRAKQGAIAAGAIPLGLGAGKIISKGAQAGGRVIGSVKGALRKHGKKIMQSDFVRSTLAPKLQQGFDKAFVQFGKPMQEFAKRKLKIAEPIVQYIGKLKPHTISGASAQYGDDVANVVNQVDDALAKQEQQITQLYNQAFRSVPQKKPVLPINKTFRSIKTALKRNGWLDDMGNLTSRADDPLQSSTLRALASEYRNLRPEQGLQKSQVGRVTQQQWRNLRDTLTNLYKKDPNQRGTVKSILNAMHREGEQAGLVGIQKARNLFVKHLDDLDNLGKISEGKLSKVFNLDQRTVNGIQRMERSLGIRILEPSRNIVAHNTLNAKLATQKIDDVVLGENEFFAKQLDSALNPAKMKTIRETAKELLGDNALVDDIFNDLNMFRKIYMIKKGAIKAGAVAGLGAAGGAGYGVLTD